MGSEKSSNEDNPPTSSCLEEIDAFALTLRRNGAAEYSGILHNSFSAGADLMSFPYMSVPAAPQGNMHGTFQSYTHGFPKTGCNLTADFSRLNSLQNPQIDLNSINSRSNMPRFLRVSDILSHEANTKVIDQSRNRDGMMTADNVINDGCRFSSQNPQVNRDFMPIRVNGAEGCQMTRCGGEVKNSYVNKQEINGNFVSLGCSNSMLYHTQNSGAVETNSDVTVNSVQFGSPKKIDGSFLTLGIGGNTNSKSKSSGHEIASKLEEPVFPQFSSSHVQQPIRNSSSLGNNLGDGFSSSACNVDGGASSYNDVGVIHGVNTALSSSPFSVLQMPQADARHRFSMSSNRSSCCVGQMDAISAYLDPYEGSRGDQISSSLAFSSPSAEFLHPGQTVSSRLASESAKLTWINTQPTSDHIQKCYVKTAKNFSPVSSMNSPFLRHRGSSSRQDHSGQLTPASEGSATQAAESDQFSRRISGQPVGQLFSVHEVSTTQTAGGSLFPRRIGVQVNESSAAQAASGGPFPKRLGVQLSEDSLVQTAGGDLFPRGLGVQTVSKGNLFRTPYTGPVQFTNNLLGPPLSTGWPPDSLPAVSIGFYGPSSATGQAISVSNVNGLSAPNVLGRPSFKRSAIRTAPAAPWAQRRKITFEPTIHPSMPYRLKPAHAAPIRLPAPAHSHIKWQGFDGPPNPTGQKCLLCKRDLSFTPEGPMYQPTAPPAVAVLPCGHTFHDHCLQVITPNDQAKDPPCIPCVIGET